MKRRDFLILAGVVPFSNAFGRADDLLEEEILRCNDDGSELQQKISLIALLAKHFDPSLALQVHGVLRQSPSKIADAFQSGELGWKHAIAFAFDRSPAYLPVLAGRINDAYTYGQLISPVNIDEIMSGVEINIRRSENLGAPRYSGFSGYGASEARSQFKGVISLLQMWLITACSAFANSVFSGLSDQIAGIAFDSVVDANHYIGKATANLNTQRMNTICYENFINPAFVMQFYGFEKLDPNSLLIKGFSFGFNKGCKLEPSRPTQCMSGYMQFKDGWDLTTNISAFSPSRGIIDGAERFVSISSDSKNTRCHKGIKRSRREGVRYGK